MQTFLKLLLNPLQFLLLKLSLSSSIRTTMCSNNSGCGTVDDLIPLEEKLVLSENKICPRCTVRKGEVVLRSKDIYCRLCLLQYLNHKFRAALGKSKMMRPRDKVLVAFSGSHSSVSLSHLLMEGMQLSSHKRILFSVCVLYIDDGGVLKRSSTERRKTNSDILKVMQNFDSYYTCIEESLESNDLNLYDDISKLPLEQYDTNNAIGALIASVASLTSKQYLVHTLRNNLLMRAAKRLNCTKIFTAETQTDLATKIIANISLGKGAHVPIDVGFSDTRIEDVITLRPLRDFSSKEIIYYNLFNNLIGVHVPSLSTLADPVGSLQKAAENFVTELQTNFPSTVSTVFRTADKLTLNLTNLDSEYACLLCAAPLDTKNQQCSSIQATSFSRYVSNSNKTLLDEVNVHKNFTDEQTKLLNQNFCYACQIAVKEMKCESNPSKDDLVKTLQKTSLNRMKKEIEEFLL